MEIKSTYKANNVSEVLDLLKEHKENAKLIAGGTDIIVHSRHTGEYPEVLIDISNIKELSNIEEKNDYIEIGSVVTFTQISESKILNEKMKGLKSAAKSVGSPQIRNLGTIGGNICNGSPAADTVPPLLALDATLVLMSKGNKREIPLDEFFLNNGTVDLKSDELLYSVRFKQLKHQEGLAFSKLGLRKALAISRICTAIYMKLDDENICKEIRIGNGALGRFGLREKKVEKYIKGKVLNNENIEKSARCLSDEIRKRLKGRSSMDFKSEAVKGTFMKAIISAIKIAKS